MRRAWTLLTFGGAVCAAAVLIILALFLAFEKRATAAAPNYSAAPTGGIEYQGIDGRPLNPANPADRQLIAGLPTRDRRLRHGEMLFGGFISATNTSARPLRSADRIDLRYDVGHVFHALPLPKSNPYAYSPRVVRPRTTVPGSSSAADEDLAAGGQLVLFRIPARDYNSGTFELVIHDPLHPAQTASVVI